MSENPSIWDGFKKNLQALVAGLAALTAGAFVQVLGFAALAFIWLSLFAAVVTIYALRFRAELLGWDELESPIFRKLENEVAQAQGIAERLMVEKSELKKKLRSGGGQEAKEENAKLRERIEELENLQSSRMDVADELRKQLRQIPNLRKYKAPLRGAQRRNYLLWHRRTVMLLEQAFGKGSDPMEEFEEIEFESVGLVTFPRR